jgi:diguanylate cyclase (GGDEF)-like protein
LNINIARKDVIDRTLCRKNKNRHFIREKDLGDILREILLRANEFVPSDSGSIFLDEPLLKWKEGAEGKLYFVACFGAGSGLLVGTSIPDNVGIVGDTYRNGAPYLSEDVKKDGKFYSEIDGKTQYESKSILALPVKIEGSVIGVIELINRKGHINFDKRDLAILEIFAKYTSTLIANALDARRFEELSKQDNLTGLYNDRYFYERLAFEVEKAVSEEGELSLIFFDLDHFKEVNDTHGHLVGSRVLKEVAVIIEEVLLETGAIPARYGGDEYVIIFPSFSLARAGEYAEMIRAAIAENTFIKEERDGEATLNIQGVVTCSIGVSSLRGSFEEGMAIRAIEEGLISKSDAAMYKAKELGKNRVCLAKK